MPSLTPQKLNFYNRGKTSSASASVAQAVASGTNYSGAGVTVRGKSTLLPGQQIASGINSGQIRANNTPNIQLQNLVGAVAAGAAAGAAAGVVNSVLDAAGIPVVIAANNPYNPFAINPSLNRLAANGMPPGGVYDNSAADGTLPASDFSPAVAFTDTAENRVIISDQTGKFIQQGGIFTLLQTTGGVLFPYTPTISVTHKANYELESLLQTNYATPYYINSSVDAINIQGRFTAQTDIEGQYVLAMMHFFKTATKMFYGPSSNKGTPPPVLFLDAHGQFMFDHIPVVVSEFQYTLPPDVNYITANLNKKPTNVPTDITISVNLIPTYSRNKISNQFSLDSFSQGKLLSGGKGTPGGWI